MKPVLVKRGRGRPRKVVDPNELKIKRGRGRPRKVVDPNELKIKRGRGRPKKYTNPDEGIEIKVRRVPYIPRGRPIGRPKGSYREVEVIVDDVVYKETVKTNSKKLDFTYRLNDSNHSKEEPATFFQKRKKHYNFPMDINKMEDKLLTTTNPIELENAEYEAKEYMYKILSYAKEDKLTPEELRKAKLFHYYATKGVRNGYAASSRTKLTSADIFYILLSEHPVPKLAKVFNVGTSTIETIKRGLDPSYAYEHTLVQSIRSIVSKNLRRLRPNGEDKVKRSVFRLSRRADTDNKLEILYHCKSKQVACKIRKTILKEAAFKRLTKKGLLDIQYPIDEVELL